MLFCQYICACFFFFNNTATPEIYTLSLHDALPIFGVDRGGEELLEHLHLGQLAVGELLAFAGDVLLRRDRKSTRLNSSHRCISYAVFCLKKKKNLYRASSWCIHLHSPLTWMTAMIS